MSLASLIKGFDKAMLLQLMPTGNTTAEAVFCRFQAYSKVSYPVTAEKLVEFALRVRKDPGFKPHAGHKRACLIPLLAIFVTAIKTTGAREMSEDMTKMITETFKRPYLERLAYLLLANRGGKIDYLKDGGKGVIDVPVELMGNEELVEWCKAPWPEA